MQKNWVKHIMNMKKRNYSDTLRGATEQKNKIDDEVPLISNNLIDQVKKLTEMNKQCKDEIHILKTELHFISKLYLSIEELKNQTNQIQEKMSEFDSFKPHILQQIDAINEKLHELDSLFNLFKIETQEDFGMLQKEVKKSQNEFESLIEKRLSEVNIL
jgi:chromosome segregation ATPase